jgi:pantoate--beta-alanine ligase
MTIFKSAKELSAFLDQQKSQNRKIGFVPTMGALHEGHLSLVQTSNSENALTVCSLFINPTQFNNAADLAHYPVTIERDIELLLQSSCNVLFLPSSLEVYGEGYEAATYDLGDLENILEGRYRPGHFQGVCQVVDKLLTHVACDNLYLGQKDYQQCMVIQRLLTLTSREEVVQLRVLPTVREAGGLAMSSRNMRLTAAEKKQAIAISQTLLNIKENLSRQSIPELEASGARRLAEGGFTVDYVAIRDSKTLQPPSQPAASVVCLIAASLGNVRLIDNMVLININHFGPPLNLHPR